MIIPDSIHSPPPSPSSPHPSQNVLRNTPGPDLPPHNPKTNHSSTPNLSNPCRRNPPPRNSRLISRHPRNPLQSPNNFRRLRRAIPRTTPPQDLRPPHRRTKPSGARPLNPHRNPLSNPLYKYSPLKITPVNHIPIPPICPYSHCSSNFPNLRIASISSLYPSSRSRPYRRSNPCKIASSRTVNPTPPVPSPPCAVICDARNPSHRNLHPNRPPSTPLRALPAR